MNRGRSMPRFIECGCCGEYHLRGDGMEECRDDHRRFSWDGEEQMVSADGKRFFRASQEDILTLEEQGEEE